MEGVIGPVIDKLSGTAIYLNQTASGGGPPAWYGVDVSTGTFRWKYQLGMDVAFTCIPMVYTPRNGDESSFYFATDSAVDGDPPFLYRLDLPSPAEAVTQPTFKWASPVSLGEKFNATESSVALLASPSIADDSVVMGVTYITAEGLSKGAVVALTIEDGWQEWVSLVDGMVQAPVAVTPVFVDKDGITHSELGVTAVGTGEGGTTVYAFDENDGSLAWSKQLPGGTFSVPGTYLAPALREGESALALVGTESVGGEGGSPGKLWALDATNGDVVWSAAIGLGRSTGEKNASVQCGPSTAMYAHTTQPVVYCIDTLARLHILDGNTGAILGTHELGGAAECGDGCLPAPQVALTPDDSLYVTVNNRLVAMRATEPLPSATPRPSESTTHSASALPSVGASASSVPAASATPTPSTSHIPGASASNTPFATPQHTPEPGPGGNSNVPPSKPSGMSPGGTAALVLFLLALTAVGGYIGYVRWSTGRWPGKPSMKGCSKMCEFTQRRPGQQFQEMSSRGAFATSKPAQGYGAVGGAAPGKKANAYSEL